jgi:hypothetical protein
MKHGVAGELEAVGGGAGDQRRGDDGEGHLEGEEQRVGDVPPVNAPN